MGDAEDADDDLLVEERGDLSMEEIPAPGKKSVRLAEVGELSTESEESGDEVDESETERNLEAVVQAVVGPPKKSGVDLYRHGITGTIHRASTEEGKLACGRKITAVIVKLDEQVHAVSSRCKVCEGYSRAQLEQ